MWNRKHRGSPLGVILGVAAAALAVIVVRSVLPDLIRYGRMHRM
jgi:zinc transporter ZupT